MCERYDRVKLTGEMQVHASLSTDIREQDANVNEYYDSEDCLERMKTRECIIHLGTIPGMTMYRWMVLHAFDKPQSR